MRISILTHWPDVVIEVLNVQFEHLNNHLIKRGFNFELKFHLDNDDEYRDWQGWGADALACGLIFGFQVER